MGYLFDAMSRSRQRQAPAAPPAAGGEVAAAEEAAAASPRAARRHEPDSGRFDDRLVALVKPSSLMAEEYRSIRTGLLARNQQRRHIVHTITSATPQEGKTITSLNLGLIMAELHNRRTIVVEADLRLPQFGKLLALPEQPGLVDVLEDQCALAEAITEVGEHGLHVLPAGRRHPRAAIQLLSSPNMVSVIKTLRQQYDHVIVDTPPVVELADAGIIGAMGDEVMLIVRLSRTPRPLIEEAARTLRTYQAPLVGVIATDQSRARRRYYYRYGYQYESYYGSEAA
jgi:capsular exopolysaccharide synthesis family protein